MVEYVVAPDVFVEEVPSTPQPIVGVSTATTAFVGTTVFGPINVPVTIQSYGEFESQFGGLMPDLTVGFAVKQFFENGGTRAVIVRVQGSNGGPIGSAEVTAPANRAAQTGIYALDKANFNLLCIPPYTPSTDLDVTADWEPAAQYCRERRAFLIVDASASWTPNDAAKNAAAFHLTARQNAALYFPRVLVSNPPAGNAPTAHAPCGVVAGIMSRTDAARGVWKAPAGIEAVMHGVAGLSASNLSAPVLDSLNLAGVNCLRALPPNATSVIWGARTLASTDPNSEWKYIPVRRLALYIQESILRGTYWAAFDSNNDKTWAQIRNQINVFMMDLFRSGAFQGRKAAECFAIRCDSTTTTPLDLSMGRLNIEVAFAPLKPAEFVGMQITQIMRQ